VAYQHAEAFNLMTYRSDDGSEEEQVWNARDGVTPFVIALRSGQFGTHVEWAADRRMPEDWTPPPGTRIFVDLTPQRARAAAEANVTRWLANPETAGHFHRVYATREAGVNDLAASYLQPGAPDLIDPSVTESVTPPTESDA
jgi:hypothetical protein